MDKDKKISEVMSRLAQIGVEKRRKNGFKELKKAHKNYWKNLGEEGRREHIKKMLAGRKGYKQKHDAE